jgi:hypothetical protein
MWHVDPLLGNDREKTAIKQPLLSNGFTNKHVSTATISKQLWKGTFFAVFSEIL